MKEFLVLTLLAGMFLEVATPWGQRPPKPPRGKPISALFLPGVLTAE